MEGGAFSKELVATISETAFHQCETLAGDLEHFAKHGKRTTVSVDDVKLCFRRSPSFLKFISRHSDSLRAAKEGGEEGRRRKGRKGHTDKAKEPEAITVETILQRSRVRSYRGQGSRQSRLQLRRRGFGFTITRGQGSSGRGPHWC